MYRGNITMQIDGIAFVTNGSIAYNSNLSYDMSVDLNSVRLFYSKFLTIVSQK